MQIQATGPTANIPVAPTGSATRSPDATQRSVAAKDEGTTSTASSVKNTQETPNSIQEATKRLQDFVSTVRSDIQFSMDQDSGKTVVKVMDSNTKEVIRQFPSEEALELAKALDRFQGLLVKQQA